MRFANKFVYWGGNIEIISKIICANPNPNLKPKSKRVSILDKYAIASIDLRQFTNFTPVYVIFYKYKHSNDG